MKLKVISSALAAIIIAMPAADAAWQVKKGETNAKIGFADAYALTPGKVVSDDGVGTAYSISRTIPHTLWVEPCWEEISILTEYAAIARDIHLAGLSRGKNSWYQIDGGPKVGVDASVKDHSRVHLFATGSPVHKFMQGIKSGNSVKLAFKHDYGELVFQFDLTGSAKAITKAKAICSGK